MPGVSRDLVGLDDGPAAGGPYRGQVRDVEHEEGRFHHIAGAGSSLGQAVAQVLEHLPRLRCGIPGPVERVTSLPELVALRREAAAGHVVRGSSGVFRVCYEEGEEVTGDLPEDGDDEPGWKVGLRVVEFGWELHSHLLGSGDEGGCDALAQCA